MMKLAIKVNIIVNEYLKDLSDCDSCSESFDVLINFYNFDLLEFVV